MARGIGRGLRLRRRAVAEQQDGHDQQARERKSERARRIDGEGRELHRRLGRHQRMPGDLGA